MKNTLRLLFSAVVFLLSAPLYSSAQTLGDEGSFTLHAFTIGLMIVGSIFLVFMGLLLTARVNELITRWKKSPVKTSIKPADPRKAVMSLDADEVDHLLRGRSAGGRAAVTRAGNAV